MKKPSEEIIEEARKKHLEEVQRKATMIRAMLKATELKEGQP